MNSKNYNKFNSARSSDFTKFIKFNHQIYYYDFLCQYYVDGQLPFCFMYSFSSYTQNIYFHKNLLYLYVDLIIKIFIKIYGNF